jgi:hypothetical protein
MSLVAELRLSDLLFFDETFEQVPDAVCEYDDVHYLTDDAGGTYYVIFGWLSNCPSDAFEAALREDATITDFRHVDDSGERSLYRIETVPFPPEQPLVYPTFREHDVTTREVRRDATGLHLKVRFPDRDALHAFLDSGEAIARRIQLERLSPAPGDEDGTRFSAAGLTRKQREALTLAYERGYFETPSRVTLSSLAEDLDVTPQTVSAHIRVGVQKLVGAAVRSDSDSILGDVLEDTSR